jgi:hypothetical protein
MDPLSLGIALANFAPSLIRLFTGSGKAADVAGHVIGIARTVTGADTGEAALEAIKADPNKLLEFRLAVAAQQVDLEKAYLADLADARAMQTAALEQDDLFSKRFIYYFAIGWSLFTMAYFFAITFVQLPPEGQRVADTILGVLIGTVLVGIFHFLYGSTQGSKVKDATIASLSR